MPVPNEQLAEPFNEDPRAVFDALVRDYQDRVFRYCVTRLGGLHGEEVAQEVFLAAWEGLSKFRHEAAIETWLLGIAKFKCMPMLRNHRRREEILQVFEEEIRTNTHPDHEDTQTEEADFQERRDQLAQSLRKLKDEERLLVNLRYTKGIAVSEIAELLGKSEAAVRKRLLRALQRLRKVMHDGAE